MGKQNKESEETAAIANIVNDVILKDFNIKDISSMLIVWNRLNKINVMLNSIHDKIENEVKKYMKKQHWSRYYDEKSKINVSLDRLENEKIDKSKLKLLLTDSQMVQITTFSTKQVIKIVSEEQRKKLKNKLEKL